MPETNVILYDVYWEDDEGNLVGGGSFNEAVEMNEYQRDALEKFLIAVTNQSHVEPYKLRPLTFSDFCDIYNIALDCNYMSDWCVIHGHDRSDEE